MAETFMGRSVVRHSPARMGRGKVRQVMHEFKEGELTSGSGQNVTSRDQAIAIALSEAGLSRKKKGRR